MPTKAHSARHERKTSRTSWKEVQTKRKRSRMVKLALSVLVLTFILLFISWAFSFTQTLFSPWKASAAQGKKYIWNGEFNLNLAIRSDHTSLLSYSPKDKRIVLINIPDEVFLEVPYGFGSWQLRAVYELGQSKKELGGQQLLKDTLAAFLGAPVDGFLDFSSLKTPSSPRQILETIRRNPFSGLNLLPELKTDLTVWELIRFKLSLQGIRFDKVKEIDLAKFLDKGRLPDGTEVLTADPVRLDGTLVDLVDPTIVLEHKTVAVFNTTNRPLLAQKAARLITNLGGNVIIISNSPEPFKKTRVFGEKSATLTRLRQIFASDDKIESETMSRAQIDVLIGEDF